jgi:hypothetical protein
MTRLYAHGGMHHRYLDMYYVPAVSSIGEPV